MPLDKLTVTGAALGIAAVAGGSALKGSGVAALLSPAALMIVVVGTVAAVLVQTPGATFRRALAIAGWVWRPPPADMGASVDRLVAWAHGVRKHGLLDLESAVDAEADPFTRRGLTLLVDGAEPEAIRRILDVELASRERADLAAARVFEGMGVYAPTMGIIGAVLGLMSVMQNLSDPDKLGTGIAAAFVATVYGIGLANLLFLPVAAKLRANVAGLSHLREVTIEGLVAIAEGEHPMALQARLYGFDRDRDHVRHA